MEQILSIQSTVTIGLVGNRVAAPVITQLGHHPLLVDTTTLAAHPGYGLIAGGPPLPAQFLALLTALAQLGALANIGTVITGYLGAADQVRPILELLNAWQHDRAGYQHGNQRAGTYILDPVLGDNGRLYVDHSIVNLMQNHLLPMAQFITPNQFELGLLADTIITSMADADTAAHMLLDRHPAMQGVVVTGVSDDAGNENNTKVYDRLITRGNDMALAYEKRAVGIAGGGDLLTAIFASGLAAGDEIQRSFTAASAKAHAIIDQSTDSREIALLENLGLLTTNI